jgi:hypothetical protein
MWLFCDASDATASGWPLYVSGNRDSGMYQLIMPYCRPSSYPAGRFALTVSRTFAIASRRSAGRCARYSSTVVAPRASMAPLQ